MHNPFETRCFKLAMIVRRACLSVKSNLTVNSRTIARINFIYYPYGNMDPKKSRSHLLPLQIDLSSKREQYVSRKVVVDGDCFYWEKDDYNSTKCLC